MFFKINTNLFLSVVFCLNSACFFAQTQDSLSTKKLSEVIVYSSRIDLPLSENSRSIQLISKEEIQQSGVNTVVDLLQQVAGLDIRRRGTGGMQADLYIRGGNFDQTLLLIDGIKVEDAQTGHHLLNFVLPLQVIERIEIVKGPAARVFGQNAFTGAINIVTKTTLNQNAILQLQKGSFDQANGQLTLGKSTKKASVLAHYSYNTSDGYRYNTDYKNHHAFFKAQLNKEHLPIDFIASFSDRKFGANGFYALPSYDEQYEETQASLVAFQTVLKKDNWILKPRLYWRRGQDMYLFLRTNPSYYRNDHITHKVGIALDASRQSTLGVSGLGMDLARTSISSNNLGQRERWVATLFAEHRFQFSQNRIDITPGIAVSNYTDFGTQVFPGIDMGVILSEQFRLIANIGYTYRIPTFTDLYYSDPTTLGNENLKAEEALAEEIGIRFKNAKSEATIRLFHRNATNLIDYVKFSEEDKFQATNIRQVNTYGVEFENKFSFRIGEQTQKVAMGYTYLKDDVGELRSQISRYSINSLKHHFTFNIRPQFSSNLRGAISYKLAQRPQDEAYHVVDLALSWNYKGFQLSLSANNIFNAVYSESNLVPMPKSNGLAGIQYLF